MKKRILLLVPLLLILSSCQTQTPVDETLDCDLYPNHVDCYVPDDNTDDPVDETIEFNFIDIFYLNDFHGAILADDDQIGFSGIAAYLENHEETYSENTLILAGGDMLQGSALSNYYDGYSTILLMNEIGFDGFVLGNHEFDWGIDVVQRYFDGEEANGEADFPLLAANVVYEGTTDLIEHTKPYEIYEIYDKKIGVIGTMGYGLEYSIATSKIDGFEFLYPVPIIAEYAEYLRTVEEVDFVIWIGHDSGNINYDVSQLSGNQKIDAMFNAHSHSDYADTYYGIPELQSGSNGEMLGHVRLYFDDSGITSTTVENIEKYESAYFFETDEGIESLVNGFLVDTDELFNTVLLPSSDSYSTSELSDWLCDLERLYTSSDIAFQNYGGTRTDIANSEDITFSTLYQIWPFDNQIKTVYLPGDIVSYLIAHGGMAYTTDITNFEDDQLYKVVTNDYVFDKEDNPFLDGTNIEFADMLLRDLVYQELLLQKEVYSEFSTDNPLLTQAK